MKSKGVDGIEEMLTDMWDGMVAEEQQHGGRGGGGGGGPPIQGEEKNNDDGVAGVEQWKTAKWYNATTDYTRMTFRNERSKHGDAGLWCYDQAEDRRGGSMVFMGGGGGGGGGSGGSGGSGGGSIGSGAHLLPLTSSSSTGSSGKSSGRNSSGQNSSGQNKPPKRPPTHYLKRLFVEHEEEEEGEEEEEEALCKTLSREMKRLKSLRHSNLLPFVGAVLTNVAGDQDNWNFELVFAGAVVYHPLSQYMAGGNSGDSVDSVDSVNSVNSPEFSPDSPDSPRVDLCGMLDICQQVASALEWLHNPNKSNGSVAHLHLNLNTVLIRGEHGGGVKSSRRALTLTSRPKWQVKVSGLELSVISNSAYCEDDIYENNTNDPAFVAPEIHLGNDGDACSDVYSMGILLWCALTRRVPFAHEPNHTIGRIVLSDKRRPEYTMSELSKIPPDVPLIPLMTSCWKKQGAERPAIHDVLREINRMHRLVKSYTGVAHSWKSYMAEFRRKMKQGSADKELVQCATIDAVGSGGGERKEEGGAVVVEATEIEMVVVGSEPGTSMSVPG
jgi:hypothetical protein